MINDAARAGKDTDHAFVAMDAVALARSARGHLVDESGISQQRSTHRDVFESLVHRPLNRLDGIDASQQNQWNRQCFAKAAGNRQEIRLLEGVGLLWQVSPCALGLRDDGRAA